MHAPTLSCTPASILRGHQSGVCRAALRPHPCASCSHLSARGHSVPGKQLGPELCGGRQACRGDVGRLALPPQVVTADGVHNRLPAPSQCLAACASWQSGNRIQRRPMTTAPQGLTGWKPRLRDPGQCLDRPATASSSARCSPRCRLHETVKQTLRQTRSQYAEVSFVAAQDTMSTQGSGTGRAQFQTSKAPLVCLFVCHCPPDRSPHVLQISSELLQVRWGHLCQARREGAAPSATACVAGAAARCLCRAVPAALPCWV